MIDFHFIINDLPPSVNRLYHPGKYGGIYKDKSAGVFLRSAWADIKKKPKVPFDSKMSLSLVFEIKDKKKLKVSDTDNFLKATVDTLQKLKIIKNDNLIYKLKDIEKRQGIKDRVIGHLTEM